MEPKFENRHKIDKPFLKELYFYQIFLSPSALILTAILAAALLLLAFSGGGSFRIVGPLYLLLFIGLRVYRYFRTVKSYEKRYLEVGEGTEVENTTLVYEEYLHLSTSNGGNNKLPLNRIKNSFSTKNYYFLRSESKLCYAFKKDGFTKGSLEEMIAFLKGKGLKVK